MSADLKRARKGLEASRADNLALVERLKYVQGYQAAAGRARKGAFVKHAHLELSKWCV